MATVSKKVLGQLDKSVGDLTFYERLGTSVVRTKPTSVANPRTISQMSTRYLFRDLMQITKYTKGALEYGFGVRSTGQTYSNAFMSKNMRYLEANIEKPFDLSLEEFLGMYGNEVQMSVGNSVNQASEFEATKATQSTFTTEATFVAGCALSGGDTQMKSVVIAFQYSGDNILYVGCNVSELTSSGEVAEQGITITGATVADPIIFYQFWVSEDGKRTTKTLSQKLTT